MLKRFISVMLVFCCLALCSCSKPNDFDLKMIPDGTDGMDYIYYDDVYTVYVVGGLMMMGEDEDAVMLEVAMHDGTVNIKDIIASAEADLADGDIENTVNINGITTYHYETFNLIVFNGSSMLDVYFTPVGVGYDSIVH